MALDDLRTDAGPKPKVWTCNLLQGLFYQIEKGVDYPGCLSSCENVIGEKRFHDFGFGESH
jgi:hypothetical protein